MSRTGLRTWASVTRPARGRVLAVHGFGEHAGRHDGLATALGRAGYDVWAGDLTGHGRAPGPRGHVDSWREYVDDVERWWRALPEGPPLLVFGHSLGGLVALDWILREPGRAHALALSSPALAMAWEPPAWRRTLAQWVSSVWPRLTQPAGIDPEGISSVPAEVEAYRRDERVHDRASASFYVSFTEAAERLRLAGVRLTCPTLVQFGEDDPIASLETAERFAATNPEWIELITYPGARHELFHETREIRERALHDLLEFFQGVESEPIE